MDNEQPWIDFVRLIRRFQIRNRVVARRAADGLDFLDSHIMIEVDSHGTRTLTDLERALMVPLTVLHRAISALRARKLLRQVASTDARRHPLALTKRGVEVLETRDAGADERMAQFSQLLTAEEQRGFVDCCERLGEGFGAPPVEPRIAEHPLRPPIRRLTRGMGLLGRCVFEARDLNSLQWHCLSELYDSAGLAVIAQTLAERFDIPRNTLSSALMQLETRGFLVRTRTADGSREKALTLTDEGRAYIENLNVSAARQIRTKVPSLTLEDMENLTRWVGRWLKDSRPSGEVVLQPRAVMRRLSGTEERQKCRSFLITQLVESGRAADVREQLLPSGSELMALYIEGEVRGLCEIIPGGASGELSWFVVSRDIETGGISQEFFKNSAWTANDVHGITRLTYNPAAISPELARRLASLDLPSETGVTLSAQS